MARRTPSTTAPLIRKKPNLSAFDGICYSGSKSLPTRRALLIVSWNGRADVLTLGYIIGRTDIFSALRLKRERQKQLLWPSWERKCSTLGLAAAAVCIAKNIWMPQELYLYRTLEIFAYDDDDKQKPKRERDAIHSSSSQQHNWCRRSADETRVFPFLHLSSNSSTYATISNRNTGTHKQQELY